MITRIKSTLMSLLAVSLAFSLGGCFLWHSGTPDEYLVPEGHFRLTADFSNGSLDGTLKFLDKPIKSQYYDAETKANVFTKEAYEAAAMEMADYLSEWTGLDFTLNSATLTEDGIVIDWSKQSTLLAGLDDREQKEDFRFFDAVSLNWFMMDTLASTLHSNLPVSFVYYCSEGQPLEFTNPEDMASQGLSGLSADEQYYGSYYYVSSSDVKG